MWRDWQMMQRLHCTYSQLEQEPQFEMEIFFAFMEGTTKAEQAMRNEENSKTHTNVVG